jgi:hypothetical protein
LDLRGRKCQEAGEDYNEELRMMKSRRMRWTGHVARMGAIRNAYNILFGKTEGKRPLGRPRCGWEDNTEMNVSKIQWESVG